MKIPFNKPPVIGNELEYIQEAISSQHICGDGTFTKKGTEWLTEQLGGENVLFTTSCTHALEMAAWLLDIQKGDEVIMPSYTFASTADAFAMRGAYIKFVDIRPDTMNIDEEKIEAAITEKTKVIVPMHYAGVGCEMDRICEIANEHKLAIVEDAAQAIMASYKNRPLGSFGNYGCFSFHETKNMSMGEGGALAIRNYEDYERAEILREKGTNRSKFWRGEIDKYTWVDLGSSYLPSELNMAYLYPQIQNADKIKENRLEIWNYYYQEFGELKEYGVVELPFVPKYCDHNAHMFYLKVNDLETRTKLIAYLKSNGIGAVFHYIPLHIATAGKLYGEFVGDDTITVRESERLIRLPLWYGMTLSEAEVVVAKVKDFFMIRK